MDIINKMLLDKLYALVSFLKKSKTDFEQVADEVDDSPLRTALNGLSVESNFFAGELKQQLKTLGVHLDYADAGKFFFQEEEVEEAGNGTEILSICTNNENKILKAYNDLIVESIPYQNLKEIMIYQMNALKYAFMKVRALNVARFSSY